MAAFGTNHSDLAARLAMSVSQDRLYRRHLEMAIYGARADGGVNRQALSAEDAAARSHLVGIARRLGFACHIDPIGNLFVRREGRDPNLAPVVTGSHLDSQPAGGKFDGTYGVLAGLEALQAFEELGIETERPIELVSWTNEEGCRFAPGVMGSSVFAGVADLDETLRITDPDGISVGTALEATLSAMPPLARRDLGTPIAAFIEAHIEQGPVLEQTSKPVGVVRGIQGARWFDVEIVGAEGHAGTTPHAARKDALAAAVALIAMLRQTVLREAPEARFTVGRMRVEPNAINTIPGAATFSIDLRHPEELVFRQLGELVRSLCLSFDGCVAIAMTDLMSMEPVVFDPRIVETIDQAAGRLQIPHMRLDSGAFHDARQLSKVCPSGMIFVPCQEGLSHTPRENAAPEDLAAGARVLALALADLALDAGRLGEGDKQSNRKDGRAHE
jgi:N-carbamoyl-L-amino-acid hydrolase